MHLIGREKLCYRLSSVLCDILIRYKIFDNKNQLISHGEYTPGGESHRLPYDTTPGGHASQVSTRIILQNVTLEN